MALNDEFRPLILKSGGEQVASDARVRIQGSKNMTLLCDFFLFEIYNLADYDLAIIQENKMIYAYAESGGLLCCGEVDDIYTRTDGANLVTTIAVVDGKSFFSTKVNRSFGGGTTISQTFRGLVQNAAIGAFVANDFKLIRGQTYSGRLADCISDLAKSVHARAFITNGTVFVSAKGKAADIINVNESDVLDSENASPGLRNVKTIMKGYAVGALVQLDGKQYRLVSQKINADNFKGSWDSTLVLVDESLLPAHGLEGG